MSVASSSSQNRSSALSPQRAERHSSLSRPSSRASARSTRAPSPSYSSYSLEDPVAVRNQISTLKHSIRHQQAQVHDLENIILRGPRPYTDLPSDPDLVMTAVGSPPSSYTSASKISKRSSFEVLHGIAGPDSNLPLPRRNGDLNGTEEGIREGIPTTYKRNSSPTRTLSRIPVTSVGNARALADEGQPSHKQPSPIDVDTSNLSIASSSSLAPPLSPNKRHSLTPGGTTKVLADLQAGVVNARNALENTKAQLRLSQRTVAQLTRQTEDLKEGRERLRLENEGLNNVVARKERLLQEVLERARKAETESTALKTQLKSETSTSKKTIREMELALAESTALSQKSEREYITLRDSIKSLTESWKADTDRLRDEMRRREERLRNEAESVGKKYRLLLEEIKTNKDSSESVKKLIEEDKKAGKAVEQSWLDEIEKLKEEIQRSTEQGEQGDQTVQQVAAELARLRRLMRNAGRTSSSSSPPRPAPS